MEKCLSLVLKGTKDEIEYMETQIRVFIIQTFNTQSAVLDSQGYFDEVGGHHDSGMGWAPDGRWCGECTQASCVNCKIWETIKLVKRVEK